MMSFIYSCYFRGQFSGGFPHLWCMPPGCLAVSTFGFPSRNHEGGFYPSSICDAHSFFFFKKLAIDCIDSPCFFPLPILVVFGCHVAYGLAHVFPCGWSNKQMILPVILVCWASNGQCLFSSQLSRTTQPSGPKLSNSS